MAIFDGDLKSMLGGMYQGDTEPAPKQMPMLEVKAKPVEVLGGDLKTVSKVVEKPLES